jgi:hypothetical protein
MPSLEARLVSGTANVVAIANVFEYEQADCRGEITLLAFLVDPCD